jgi:catechol 2,3-dioxygenase-like lactoylglutathione lyase family enzyme
MIESISAVTLATHDMGRAVRFYRTLGFELLYGGEDAQFTSFRAGTGYLNLIAQPAERRWSWWGRVIFYDSDVDALHARAIAAGYRPDSEPRTRNGASAFFTSPTRTGTSSASPGRCAEHFAFDYFAGASSCSSGFHSCCWPCTKASTSAGVIGAT